MLETFFMTIFCILAVYGAVKFIFMLYGCFANIDCESIKRHMVIFLNNNENDVEGFLRSMALEHNQLRGDIIAVLNNSKDKTREILLKLENEYEMLRVMTMEEYIDFVKDI